MVRRYERSESRGLQLLVSLHFLTLYRRSPLPIRHEVLSATTGVSGACQRHVANGRAARSEWQDALDAHTVARVRDDGTVVSASESEDGQQYVNHFASFLQKKLMTCISNNGRFSNTGPSASTFPISASHHRTNRRPLSPELIDFSAASTIRMRTSIQRRLSPELTDFSAASTSRMPIRSEQPSTFVPGMVQLPGQSVTIRRASLPGNFERRPVWSEQGDWYGEESEADVVTETDDETTRGANEGYVGKGKGRAR